MRVFVSTFLISTLLVAPAFAGGSLDQLRERLQQLDGSDEITARLSHSSTRTDGEGKDAKVNAVAVQLTAKSGPQGLTLSWDPAQLEISKEVPPGSEPPQGSLSQDASKPKEIAPPKRSVGAFPPRKVVEFLDVSKSFLERIKGAALVDEKPDSFQGAPARLLVLKLDPHLDAQSKKYIKQIEATARIWVDDKGTPLGAETSVSLKGRAYLVITFDSAEKEIFRFAQVGRRLLVTQYDKSGAGSGAGEKSSSVEITTLQVL